MGASLICSVVLVAVVYVIAVASGFADDISRAKSLRGELYPPPARELPMERMIMRSDFIAVVNLESVSRGVEKFTDKFPPCRDGYSMTLDYTFEVEEYLKGAGEDRIVATVFYGTLARTPVGALLFERPDKHRRTTWDDRKAIVFLKRDSDWTGLSSLIWKPGRYFLAHTDKRDQYSVVADYGYKAWLPAVSASADEQTFILDSDQKYAYPRRITLDEIKAMMPTLPHETFRTLPEC